MTSKTLKSIALALLCAVLNLNLALATDVSSTFTNAAGDVGTGEPAWTVGNSPAYEADRGLQWSKKAGSLTNTSLSSNTITKVVVVASANCSATISVKVGTTSFSGSGSISSGDNKKSFTFTGSATGNIVVSTTAGSKSVYIKTITVTYSGGGGTTYTVTYDANGGIGSMTDSNSPYSSGATVTTLANTFTRDGYTFTGWNTAANGSGASYAAGATFTISANTTLYAQWAASAAKEYVLVTSIDDLSDGDVIVFGCSNNNTVADGSSGNDYLTSASTTITTGVLYSSVALEFSVGKSGDNWTFTASTGLLGTTAVKKANASGTGTTTWTLTIDGSGNATLTSTVATYGSLQYNASSPRFASYTSSQTAIQIYKEDSGTKYDITWNNGGHGTAPTAPTSAASVTLPELEAEGYTHTGWKADQTVKVGGVDKSAGTLLENGAKATLTANTTFTAQWEVETYTITLTKSSYDCATDGSITIQYNATEPTSFTPATRTGYIVSNGITATDVFGGYCNGPSGGSRIFNPDGTFAADNITGFITNGKWTNTSKTLVLHPRWEENCSNMVNVSVNVSGGHGTATANKTPVSTCSCTNGDRLVKITATPETGYVVENITWATTSGTVTATKQDGNSGKTIWSFYFAQDNSGAGTFTVTFVEQKKYHITFINNLHGGSTSTSAECDENVSTSITFPSISDATESTGTSCEEEHFHFVGWVKNGQAVTDANIKKAGSNTVKLTSNETYYAVWAKKVTGTGNTYKILTSSDDITTGDYVIAAYNSATSYYVLSSTTSTYNMSGSATIAVSSGTITNPTTARTWTITKTGTKITIKNKDNNKYLYVTSGTYQNLKMQNNSANFTYTKGSGTTPSWKIFSESVSGYLIEWYSEEFKPYTDENSSNKIYLFRREDSYGDYITSCAPPTTWSVVYDANGKTLSPGVSLPAAVTDLEENVDFTVPANNYVSSPDYAQIGWNTDATATTGLTTVPGQTAGTVVTLYAIWQKSQVEVVEVNGNNDIIIEHNFGGNTGAELDKWSTVIKGATAKDIFFSKYFEASSNVKLIAIFNGTGADKDVSDLRIHIPWYNENTDLMPEGNYHRYVNIGTVLTNAGRSTTLKNGDEVILYSYQPTATTSGCSRDQAILDSVAARGVDMSNWIPITYAYMSSNGGENAVCFSGKEPILLERNTSGSTWTPIDIIGAVDNSLNAIFPTTTPSWGDAEGWICSGGKNLKDTTGTTIQLSTNRCLLVRKFSVLDGSKAVASNKGAGATFATLCSEWYGYHVDKKEKQSGSGCAQYANDSKSSAEGFAYVGAYDYNSSYEKYTTVEPDEFTATNNPDGTMTIHIDPDKVDGGLASLSCDMLKIKVTDNTTGDVLGQVEYKVPIIVTTSGTETDNDIFTKFDDCSTCDVVILQDATLAPNASGKNTLRDLEIYRGAKLNVPDGKTLTVNNLIMRSKGDVTPQADIQGTLNRKDTKLYFDKRVDENQWYWIALPYDCNMADVTFRNGDKPTYGVGKDWVLKTYNGVKRANTQSGGCWETVPENSTLKAGVGYILGITPKAGHAYVEIRFPMTASQWDKNRATVTVPVTPTAKDGITPNHVGWNLVGNPYLTNYAPGYVGMDNADNSNNLIPLGLLQENAENEYERVGSTRYVVIPQNGGYSEYKQVAIGDQALPTFMSYFIQIDGNVGTNYAVDFKYANSRNAAPARRAPEEYMEEPEDNHPVWVPVTLANVKGEKDETTFLISNQFTDKYDLMDDLLKWRGDYYQYPSVTTKPVLASRNSEAELAFNALPDNSAWNGIPLNYFATNAGMYTIELSDKYGLDEVAEAVLYDATTKVRHDLKSESYTFSSDRTDNTDRFTLYIRVERKKAPEVATDFGNLTTDDKPQKVLVNGNVYILRGGKVFDITGKQVR